MSSRAEQARDQIATAISLIATGDGYQTSVANVSKAIVHPDTLHAWPHVCVELGRSVIEPATSKRDVFTEFVDINIVGFVRADTEATTDHSDMGTELQDAMEALIWDLKVLILTDLVTVNITSNTNAWNIELADNVLEFQRSTYLGNGRNLGVIETKFVVRIRHQDSDFTEDGVSTSVFLLAEDGAFLVAG